MALVRFASLTALLTLLVGTKPFDGAEVFRFNLGREIPRVVISNQGAGLA